MPVDMYIKIGDIDGESTDRGHTNEIDVLAWSWGMANSNSVVGGGGTGKAVFQDLSVTKWVDKSSTALMMHAASGKVAGTAQLALSGGARKGNFMKVTMSDVLVTSLSVAAATEDERPTETVSFNFTKVEIAYSAPDGTVNTFSWNLEEGRA